MIADAEFHYRVPWRASSPRPGYHPSSQSGGGFEFHGHEPLLSHPDPRNLDIRASLLDPFERYVVRSFRQRSCIPVQIVADLSASVTCTLGQQKLEMLISFVRTTAHSAYRTGDPFAFHGAAEHILDEQLQIPLRWYRSLDETQLDRLRTVDTSGQRGTGLAEVAGRLGQLKSLVFLVSDFHFDEAEINRVMDALAPHDIVPVVLWSSTEYQDLPDNGLVRLHDPESGRERTLLMRPALRQRWQTAFENRRKQLRHYFSLRGREPFFLVDRLDTDQLTEYFCQE